MLHRSSCFAGFAGRVTALALIAIATLTEQAVSVSPPFAPLIGTWSGNGQLRLDDGRSEQIKCRAYYTERESGLRLALRCASGGSKIDLRAQLNADGTRINGTWEERQFNAAGSIAGTSTGNRLMLSMDGGGLKAVVAVTTSGATQTVTITTDAATLRSAQIGLLRDSTP